MSHSVPGRRKGSTNVPWDDVVAMVREHPNAWVAHPAMAAVPERTLIVIRRQERRQLQMDDGKVRVRVAGNVTIEGKTTLTLMLKFIPKEVPVGT